MYARLGGTLTRDRQWANLIASMDQVNATPLPDKAGPDQVQTRQLLIATLARAEATLQGSDQAAADQAYSQARDVYNQFAAEQHKKEMPSAFALWLANLGLDISNPLVKAGGIAALVLGVAIAGPPIIRAVAGSGGSKSW